MNHLMLAVSLIGILSTAVVCGTDMFFLTVGRPALRLASPSAGTEVMGFIHIFGDARMPIRGVGLHGLQPDVRTFPDIVTIPG